MKFEKMTSVRLVAAVCVFGACLGVSYANPVSVDMACTVAKAWVEKNKPFGLKGPCVSHDVLSVCDTNRDATLLWYQVPLARGGCVIVSPVTEIDPVVAVLDDNPGELPAAHPLRAILTGDLRRRLRFHGLYTEDAAPRRLNVLGRSSAPSGSSSSDEAKAWADQSAAKWNRLVPGIVPVTSRLLRSPSVIGVSDADLDVLVRVADGFEKGGRFTHWNQSSAGGGLCFNYYTPGHSVCGCVATAAAALMQWFAVTEREADIAGGGDGSSVVLNCASNYENTCSYNKKTEKYQTKGGPYDFTKLPKNWGGTAADSDSLTDEQREILGRLAYDAGVCFGMMWTDGESGAFTTDTAGVLRDNFGFTEARLVTSPRQDDYRKLICMQNWCGVPVGMGIEGHAVVAVGYGRDADGTDRTRVFMGWGGTGDAWYALPKIDTTAVMGGSSYLSEVVNSITTMISLGGDHIVPVCGQIIPSMNAAVTVGTETTQAGDTGFFGLRVAPQGAGSSMGLVCEGKSTDVLFPAALPEAQADQGYKCDGAELAAAIPDDLVMTLINSESATSFVQARAKALRDGKPMFLFSGSGAEEMSIEAWKVVQDLDDGNVDDFTNRFVIAYFPFSTGAGNSDGNPSYAVFNPLVAEPEDRWMWWNGRRLSYGFARAEMSDADVRADVKRVLQQGWDKWCRLSSDVAVTIAGDPGEQGEPLAFSPMYGVTNAVGYGVFTNEVIGLFNKNGLLEDNALDAYGDPVVRGWRVGESVRLSAPYVYTNTTDGCVWTCTGGVLVARVGATVTTNTFAGPLGEFTVQATNTSYGVTWLWTDAQKPRIRIRVKIDTGSSLGTIESAEGDPDEPSDGFPYVWWYDWSTNTPVTITAVPAAGCYVSWWHSGSACVNAGATALKLMPNRSYDVHLYIRSGLKSGDPLPDPAYVITGPAYDPVESVVTANLPEIAEIRFDARGGTDGDVSLQVAVGQPLPTTRVPVRAGYRFAGYRLDGELCYDSRGRGLRNCTEADKGKTLSARWLRPTTFRLK